MKNWNTNHINATVSFELDEETGNYYLEVPQHVCEAFDIEVGDDFELRLVE